jgi:hypothetical protein
VACIVTSVSPYPSPMTALGSTCCSRSMSVTGSGAAPEETPRTPDQSASRKPGTCSSATNTGGAPPIEVTAYRTASST